MIMNDGFNCHYLLTTITKNRNVFKKILLGSVSDLSVSTALHAMQTRSSDEKSVCLSVRQTREL